MLLCVYGNFKNKDIRIKPVTQSNLLFAYQDKIIKDVFATLLFEIEKEVNT